MNITAGSHEEHILGLVIDLEAASNAATTTAMYWNNVQRILPMHEHIRGRDRVIDDLHDGMVEAKKNRDSAWDALIDALQTQR